MMLMAVVGVVVVPVVGLHVVVPARAAAPPAEHPEADADDEEARSERQPGIELLGHDELGEQERHQAEPEHAGRVGDRHRRAENERVARAPRVPTR